MRKVGCLVDTHRAWRVALAHNPCVEGAERSGEFISPRDEKFWVNAIRGRERVRDRAIRCDDGRGRWASQSAPRAGVKDVRVSHSVNESEL